jgi:hypothetical protein
MTVPLTIMNRVRASHYASRMFDLAMKMRSRERIM